MTNRGLAPEIAHFRTPNEPQWVSKVVSGEWYIKGSQCVTYLISLFWGYLLTVFLGMGPRHSTRDTYSGAFGRLCIWFGPDLSS